ncbi:hypothetical protein I552_1310 [Mycobacterium xenopi 3993]|nr:hypothetical protein I552_1310 [Mycobacterium xenopi 3993]
MGGQPVAVYPGWVSEIRRRPRRPGRPGTGMAMCLSPALVSDHPQA